MEGGEFGLGGGECLLGGFQFGGFGGEFVGGFLELRGGVAQEFVAQFGEGWDVLGDAEFDAKGFEFHNFSW